ncbi:hypothetical protein [Larkinella soli]|uniref:hypothetical protein n=1 Tax=Larkinella soli TaxID=1770527 RepID=UPI000FFBA1BB|nr:hypothetical protein [Larkinella soli]
MKRSEKLHLLARLLEGRLDRETLRRYLQPRPLKASGVVITLHHEPQPTDEVAALLHLAAGRTLQQQMTLEQFERLETEMTLFILPHNHR